MKNDGPSHCKARRPYATVLVYLVFFPILSAFSTVPCVERRAMKDGPIV